MNHISAILVAVALTGISYLDAIAQSNTPRNDSIATALKLKGLQTKKEQLEKEIKVQDGKRNSQIAGVAPETMEEINNRQDSVCLALRSELVDVILEIKEITPIATPPQFIQQYNNLMNKKDENPQSSSVSDNTKETEK